MMKGMGKGLPAREVGADEAWADRGHVHPGPGDVDAQGLADLAIELHAGSHVMHLLKIMLKAGGKQGVPQGGVISPLLSNIYLTEVDRMLERAKEASRDGKYTYVEYARFADDLVILIDAYKRHDWLERNPFRLC